MLAATIHPSSAATLPRLCSPPASPCSTQELQNQLHRDNLLPSNSYTSLTPSLDTWSSPIFLKDPSFLPSADTTPILNHWDLFDMDPFMNLAFNSNNMSQNVAANSTVSSVPAQDVQQLQIQNGPDDLAGLFLQLSSQSSFAPPSQNQQSFIPYNHVMNINNNIPILPPIDVIFSNHYQTQPHAPITPLHTPHMQIATPPMAITEFSSSTFVPSHNSLMSAMLPPHQDNLINDINSLINLPIHHHHRKPSIHDQTPTPTTSPPLSISPHPVQLPTAAETAALLALPSTTHPCNWASCTETFTTPSDLYDHLTQFHGHIHVKSTYSIQCQWRGCKNAGKTFGKRNHFVSHCRAHVEFWGNGCGVCGRAFKWPHDLKKHRDKTGHAAATPTRTASASSSDNALRKTKSSGIKKNSMHSTSPKIKEE